MVRCDIVIGHTRTPLIDAYLNPSTLEHLQEFEEALNQFEVLEPIVPEDFNVNLDDIRSSRSQRMADLLTEFGLIDLVRHFRQHHHFWYLKTWTKFR